MRPQAQVKLIGPAGPPGPDVVTDYSHSSCCGVITIHSGWEFP